jgi:hypothetical protein
LIVKFYGCSAIYQERTGGSMIFRVFASIGKILVVGTGPFLNGKGLLCFLASLVKQYELRQNSMIASLSYNILELNETELKYLTRR